MRVRMLQTYEQSLSNPDHGALKLVYSAGSVQHFDESTASSLTTGSKPIAERVADTSLRVQMLRTITETELAELITAARQRAGDSSVAIASPGNESYRYPKGALVHFPIESANALINAIDANGSPAPVAKDAPDSDYDPIAATKSAATDAAIHRAKEQKAADARRAEMRAKSQPSKPVTVAASPTPSAVPSAVPSASTTSAAPSSSAPALTKTEA